MNSDNKNFLIAIVLSVAIIFGWQIYYAQPEIERQRALEEKHAAQTAQGGDDALPQAVTGDDAVPPAGGTATPADAAVTAGPRPRDEVIAETARIEIKTPKLSGSINLEGGKIDDLKLLDYRETVDPGSATIVLLSPSGAEHGFYADAGWAPPANSTVKLPTPKTVWAARSGSVLTPQSPVTLNWDNGEGLTFKHTISVDNDYMFSVRQEVANNSANTVVLYPYGRVQRQELPTTQGIYVLHEGLIGFLNEELHEVDYDDVKEDPKPVTAESTGGWLGITDKYWAVALVPAQDSAITGRFSHRLSGDNDRFQTDFSLKAGLTVTRGQTGQYTSHLFAGAKVAETIDRYNEELKIAKFDLMIDWGWFYFITKPLFWLINHLQKWFGNFGLAILLTTVILKIAFFPLANKSYASMAKMKILQPEMLKIRERFADDKMRQQQAMMELYKKEKVSPMSGCLPVLVQIPVFFALYKVLFVTIEMRHAPFYGWIRDLSAPDPTSLFNLFGLIPWEPPLFMMIGVLPLIMGITMWIQMRLNPAPPDPIQAQIFMWMPLFFTFLLASFPAGLVLYWAWNNFLSILQQYTIMKRQGADVNLIENIKEALPFIFKKKSAE